MDVKGKGVFITGGARGIGRAVVELLLQKEAKVVFCDINTETGEKTLEELRQRYPSSDVTFVPCDVTDSGQLKESFDNAVARFGAVDICINNAGILDEKNWERCIAVNQIAAMRGSLIALEHMRRDKGGLGGVIIITASFNSWLYGSWHSPTYTSTKHAILAFATCHANDPNNAAHGVRWGVVCPGACATRIVSWDTPVHFSESVTAEEFKKFCKLWESMTTREAALAFLTILEDEESNGGAIYVHREGGKLYQEMRMMDKSSDPCTTFYTKYTKEQPGELASRRSKI